jgi:hypothetical protein
MLQQAYSFFHFKTPVLKWCRPSAVQVPSISTFLKRVPSSEVRDLVMIQIKIKK